MSTAVVWDQHKEARLHELVARADGLSGQEYVEACRLLQQSVGAHRGGVLMPDSSEIIHEMREERDMRNIGEEYP